MSSKKRPQNAILKALDNKKAISVNDLKKTTADSDKYALTRALKNLGDSGLIETISSGQSDYVRLTKQGRVRANSKKLEAKSTLVSAWDGKWRIIILDLPESRKSEREALRYLLKKASFRCVKNTVWVSPYPFEHLFANIKKDLNLTTELMIIVTDSVDEETEKVFRK